MYSTLLQSLKSSSSEFILYTLDLDSWLGLWTLELDLGLWTWIVTIWKHHTVAPVDMFSNLLSNKSMILMMSSIWYFVVMKGYDTANDGVNSFFTNVPSDGHLSAGSCDPHHQWYQNPPPNNISPVMFLCAHLPILTLLF